MTKKERKVGIKEGFNYIGAWSNENHQKNHIAYFEKKLEREIEPYKLTNINPYAQCHNYAAWIRLYTELICNKLAWSLHRAKGDWENIIKLDFVKLEKSIENEVKKSRIKSEKFKPQNILKALNYVIELRHSFQHGGMPNPMRVKISKDNEKVLIKMINPRYYKRIKVIFLCADELFELIPKPIIGF